MGARNSESRNLKFYSLKAKVDETNDPFFALSKKTDSGWETESFTELFGKITKAEIIEKDFKEVKSNLFRFNLIDDNETSVLDMTHNAISYSILNTLSSDFDVNKEVSIRVYKVENTGNDGKKYWNGRSYITVEGEKLGWAIDIADLPKPEQLFKANGDPVITNGKNTYDKSPVIDYWENVFNTKIKSKFNSNESDPNVTNSTPSTENESDQAPGDDDDLPF